MVERDVCLLIGLYNERGASVTQKVIRSRDVAPQATLERVLLRLVREGIVHQSLSPFDGRCRELKLDTIIARKLRRFKFSSRMIDD
jgi:DNA-binding MarR family transcriptional regulator